MTTFVHMNTSTPQEKAKELLAKFAPLVRIPRFGKRSVDRYYLAKEAANICISEVIYAHEHMDENIIKRKEAFRPLDEVAFWHSVKQELSKM